MHAVLNGRLYANFPSITRCEPKCPQLCSDNRPSSLRTVQNGGKISMVLDPLFDYFVFLIYTEGYSNHYRYVWGTVLAISSGIRRQKI